MNEQIRTMIHHKYIEPTEKKREMCIGVEVELPIVNLQGKATDHTVCQKVFLKAIRHFGFEPVKYDFHHRCHEAVHKETGDIFSFDCSFQNFEISFGKERRLQDVDYRFHQYLAYWNKELSITGHIITGMGVQPYYNQCSKQYIPNKRYQMLEGYLKKSTLWKKEGGFHSYPAFGTFTSSTQMQLDVQQDQLIRTLKVFSLLEPVKSLLFSNSVMQQEPDYLCARDMLWEFSTHGINPRNVGMYDTVPASIEEMIDYIAYTSIFCTERDGKYVFFHPIPIAEYFAKKRIEAEFYQDGHYVPVLIEPQWEDLNYLRTYKFLDLTARGTIEYRSLCTQPLKETFGGIALQLGLAENLYALERLFHEDTILYHHGFSAHELRKMFNVGYIPDLIDRNALIEQILDIVRLSEEGLRKRGYGEEKYLGPVFDRALRLSSAAKDMKEYLAKGRHLNEVIREYAEL